MPQNLVDELFKQMHKGMAMPSGFEVRIKEGISRALESLVELGYAVVKTGDLPKVNVGTVAREAVELEPYSFFCPHCGKHKPRYGLNGQTATLPGFGEITYMTLFCGEDSCRKILQVIIAGADVQGSAKVQ